MTIVGADAPGRNRNRRSDRCRADAERWGRAVATLPDPPPPAGRQGPEAGTGGRFVTS